MARTPDATCRTCGGQGKGTVGAPNPAAQGGFFEWTLLQSAAQHCAELLTFAAAPNGWFAAGEAILQVSTPLDASLILRAGGRAEFHRRSDVL